jgi:hypothetical protein
VRVPGQRRTLPRSGHLPRRRLRAVSRPPSRDRLVASRRLW